MAALIAGLSFGLVAGFVATFIIGLGAGLGVGLGVGLVIAYAGVFAGALAAVPGDLASAASPRAVLVRDKRTALLLMLTSGVGAALAAGLAAGLRFGFVAGLWFGLAAGLLVGLIVSGTKTAWPSYIHIVWLLALRGCLPRSLMTFLADAHQRGVLRQAGAVYQFRHIELQHRLATREPRMARIGRGFDVRDSDGDPYRVILLKVVDPVQGADELSIPVSGRRFVSAVFRVAALSGSPEAVDAYSAAIVGSDGQTYASDLKDMAGHTNFGNGTIHVPPGGIVTGSVTFQMPERVEVARVQWTPAGRDSTVYWEARR